MLSRSGFLKGVLLALVLCPVAGADPANFTIFAVPGAHVTTVAALDNHGNVTGVYSDNQVHGFIRQHNGHIDTFDVPGATLTLPRGMNGGGTIAGDSWFGDVPKGFLRAADGEFTTFGVDGARDMIVRSINDNGWVAGIYRLSDDQYHGFVRSPDGAFTGFDVPGATSTYATAMQPDNSVLGYWSYDGERQHDTSFSRAPDGTISTFGVRGYASHVTSATHRGAMAGTYFKKKTGHGFLRLRNGRVLTLDPSETAHAVPSAIGAGNVVVGQYIDASGHGHGFVFTASRQFVTIDMPNASNTAVSAVNDRGKVAGWFGEAGGDRVFAFLATP